MYPSPVRFQKIEPGRGGVAIRWSEPRGIEVDGYAVYRASRAIAEDETEAFYGGALGPAVVRIWRPAQPPAYFDPEPPSPAWYLVQAIDGGGDLHQVDVTLRPIQDPSVYEERAPLVFRDDDPLAAGKVLGTVKALLSRHDEGDD